MKSKQGLILTENYCLLSSVQSQHRQRAGAQHGTRPRQLMPWCHSHTLHSHCQMCKSAGGFYTAARASGTALASCTAASLATARRLRGRSGASHELLLPAGSGLRGCHIGSSTGHRQGDPEPPHPHRGAQASVCPSNRGCVYLGRHSSHGGEPSPLCLCDHPRDRWLIKTLRPRAPFPQRAQDNPPLLPSLPLTSHEQAQGYFMLPAKV